MGLLDDAIREHLDLKRARGADPAEIERLEREALGPVRREPTIGTAQLEAPEHHEPAVHELSVEELEEYGYDDSAGPRPDGHQDHAAARFDQDRDHGLPEHLPAEAEPEPQPKRRFLRRTRPASLGEPTRKPEPSYEEHADFEYHDAAENHGVTEQHDIIEHQDIVEHHDLADGADRDQTAQHEAAQPPQLQFERPPQRPRFTPEPPGSDAPAPGPAAEPDLGAEERDEEPPTELAVPEPLHDEQAQQHSEPQPTHEFNAQGEPEDAPSDEGDEDVLEETPEFLQDTPEHDRLWFEQRPPKDFDFDG